jgi:sorting nexin-1/2
VLSARVGANADIQPVFVITVDDPQKIGDPIRSFTMYTVFTRVCGISIHPTHHSD